MAVLLPVYSNFVNRSLYRINGGSITFTNVTNYLSTQFVETTNLDLSIFMTYNPNNPSNRVKFYLTVFYTDGLSDILWEAETTTKLIGYTIPKKIYNLGVKKNISKITITSPYSDIYFQLWNPNKSVITISRNYRPNLLSSTNNLIFSYDDRLNYNIIPSSTLLIQNTILSNYTGKLNWYVLSSPLENSASTNTTIMITNNINGLELYNSSDTSTQLVITSNIYYNANVYIVAVNSEGLMSQVNIKSSIMSYPRISNTYTYYKNLSTYNANINTNNYIDNSIGNIISQGSGPITWNIISNYSTNLTVSDINGYCIFNTSNYINQNNIVITASNNNYRNNIKNVTSNTINMIAAYTPSISAPKTLVQSIAINKTYTFSNINNTIANTGPLFWYLQNNIDGISIDNNKGYITSIPNINSNITIVTSNVLGNKSLANIHVNTEPLPDFVIPSTIYISTINSTNSFYQFNTLYMSLYPSIKLSPVTWSMFPNNINGVTLNNNTGLVTLSGNIYTSNSLQVSATNSLGYTITSNATLIVAATPKIVNPGYQRHIMTNSNYKLQLQVNNCNITGPLVWNILNSNLYTGISINSNGLLTVNTYNPINTNISINAINKAFGSNIVTFPINISQQPSIINPGNQTCNLLPSSTYNINLYEFNTSNNSNVYNKLNWYINKNKTVNGYNNIFNIYNLNSNIALFSVASNTVCNQLIYVNTSNLTGESAEMNFNLSLAIIPDFVCPPTIYGNVDAFNYLYTYQFEPLTQQITSWNILDSVTDSPINGLTINNSGLLTFDAINNDPSFSSYNNTVSIVARNANNYSTVYNTQLNLQLSPLITQPSINDFIVSTTNSNFTYLLQGNNAPIKQFYLTNPYINGISINSTTGLITITSNIYYGETVFGVGASNDYAASNLIQIPINIAQTPNLINPGNISCNLMNGVPFNYQITNNAIGTGPLIWNITRSTLNNDIVPGLSISSTGLITLESSYAYDDFIKVSAQNNAQNKLDIVTSNLFKLTVGHTPIIVSPPNIIANTILNKIYTYQFTQIAQGTGTMFSKLTNMTPTISSNISLTNSGLLTINSNIYLQQNNINAQFSNITGGYCNITFNLIAASIPQFSVPNILSQTLSNSSIFNYTLNTITKYYATSNVYWSTIPSYIPGLLVSSSNNSNFNITQLNLQYTSNTYVNCNITIIASNSIGGYSSQDTKLIFAQVPIINNPIAIGSNINNNNNNLIYTYSFAYNSNTGPLTWYIRSNIAELKINDSVLSYNNSYALSNNIIVSASNILGVSCNINVSLIVTQTPIISNPGNITSNMYTNNFTYKMINTNSIQSGLVKWSLTPNIPNLSINSDTGLITFLNNNLISCNVTVSAKNYNNISGNVTFNLTVAKAPGLIAPPNNRIYASVLPNTIYKYLVEQSNINTGPIIWSITDTNKNNINGVFTSNVSSRIAYITVNSNTYINQQVVLQASNIYGAISTQNINMIVAQIPILVNPITITSNVPTLQSFVYRISNLVYSQISQPYTWTTNNSTINLDRNNGVLTVLPNIGINSSISLTASNILGAYCNINFNLTITDNPLITNPGSIRRSVNFYDTYNLQLINTNARSISSGTPSWSLSNSSYPGLSINNTGLISLQSAFSIDNLRVNVVAYLFGFSNIASFNMYVLRSPSIIRPPNITSNITSIYNYQMTRNTESNEIIPTTWNINTKPIPQGLSIISLSGIVSFSPLYNINQTINIMASNVLGGCNIVPFSLNLSPLPYLTSVLVNSKTITSNSVELSWNGNFVSNVNIYANSNISAHSTTYINSSSISNIPYSRSPYVYTNLTANKGYNFSIVPFNSLNAQSNSLITSNIVTLPSQITKITTIINPYSCVLNWDNIYQYSYLSIGWSNQINFTTSNSQDLNSSINNYTISNIWPNASYGITVNPYNYSNVIGLQTKFNITTLPDVSTNITSITYNSAILNWSSITSNGNNRYVSYSNILININGPNINSNYNYTSNIIKSQAITKLNENALYNVKYTVYNSKGTSRQFTTNFSTLSKIPKLVVTEPITNSFNISWAGGNYSYVKYVYNNFDNTLSSNTIYDSSVSFYISLNYTMLFTVYPYNSCNVIGQSSSVYIQKNSGTTVIYYS